MRWQKALTRKQMAHLRWSVNGNPPTLTQFRILRTSQRKMERDATTLGHFTIACHDCNEIERRLVAARKMEVTK